MTRISKHPVSEKVLIKIYELFFQILAHSHSQEKFSCIIDDLLSPTEKVMIAKRIAILYLLIKGIPHTVISQTLKVSSATVAVYAWMLHKKEATFVSDLKKIIAKEKLVEGIDDVLAEIFIQPGLRLGHWQKYWNREREKNRKRVSGI
jgi:Trp operon repressor